MAELSAGTKLSVLLESEKDDNNTITLTSSLEGFGANKRLLITAPMRGETIYPIPAGKVVVIQYYDKSAIIAFDAAVLQRIDRGTLSYLLLEQKSDFRRTQRRQDFRMDCMLDGFIDWFDPDGGGTKKRKALIVDLSGGGAALRSEHTYSPGEETNVYLPLSGNGTPSKFRSIVRRCMRVDGTDSAMRYNIGVEFKFETPKEKEALIAHIFKMERERRKRSNAN